MAAAATTLKRTVQELDNEVAPSTEKVQLAQAVVKRSNIKDSKHLFTRDPLDLILTLHVEHEPLSRKVVSARPHTCIFRSRSNCDAEHFDLGHDNPFPWEDVSSFWGQSFFQGTKLALKPLGATDGDEVVCVPLDEHGICTLGTFVDTVCDLKVGTPYDDKISFTIASTKVLQDANDEDADGAVATYEWE